MVPFKKSRLTEFGEAQLQFLVRKALKKGENEAKTREMATLP